MKRLLLVLGLALSVSPAQEPAARPQDLASLLPADTLVLLEADDLGGFDRWTKNTALGRAFMEPEVQQFVQGLVKALDGAFELASGGLGMVGLEKADLQGIEIRRFGLALVDFEGGRPPTVDAVLSFQARTGAAKIEKIVTALRQGLVNFLAVPFQESKLRGRTVWEVPFQTGQISFGFDRGRFLLTTQRARMQQLLAALDEGQAQPLRQAPRYAGIMRRMGVDRSALTVYADVRALHDKGVAIARQEAHPRHLARFERIWTALGLDSVKAFALADIPLGTGFRTEMAFTLAGAEPRGLFRLPNRGQVDHRFARFAPRNCLAYGAEKWNPERGWQSIRDLWLALDRRGPRHVEQFLGSFKQALGADFETDLLASLGEDWAGFLGSPPGGGLIPDLALFVTVKDRARLERTLETISRRIEGLAAGQQAPLKFKQTTFRGLRIHFMESQEIPLNPCWALGEDYLVFALNPHTIRNVLGKRPSLAESADFRALLRQVPQTASSSSYLNTRDLFGWCYNTLVPILQAAQGAIHAETALYGLRLNLEDLPPAEVITRHLSGTLFYTAPEPGCLRMGYVSPFGSALVAGGLVALAGAAHAAEFIHKGTRQDARRRHRRLAEAVQLRAQLAQQRATYEKRLEAIEKQLAELKKQIEESGK